MMNHHDSNDKWSDGEGSLMIVTDEELQNMTTSPSKSPVLEKKSELTQPRPQPEMDPQSNVVTIHFPVVPKQIVWSDGEATYTFECVGQRVDGGELRKTVEVPRVASSQGIKTSKHD
ncbi:unnamed protein product [Larinioides sclopetarius]|uniref:Uncharacterized protein n=1 Tax=Larinioides sclopetarius TaxID=280406 RepID=A0AAV1Z3L8_9ARAC